MSGLVYTLPGVAALIAAMLVGAALFARVPTRQLAFFGIMNVGTFLWAGGYFLGYTLPAAFPPDARAALGTVLFVLAQLGVALLATYFFLFTCETTGAGEWARGRWLWLAHVPGAVLLLSAVTNPLHYLFVRRGDTGMLVSYGPLGTVSLVAIYALVVASCVLWFRAGTRDTLPNPHVSFILAILGTVVLVTNVLWTTRDLTGLTLPYNPTILLLPVMGVFIAGLVMRAGLIDVVPVAEGQAFHEMADGGIVLTASGRILAINHAASRMIPKLRAGHLLAEDAPALAKAVERLAEGNEDTPRGEQSWWVRVVPMRSPSGRQLGMLVLLTDLAEKRAFEQRIVELNRDLRRTVLELEAATRAKDRFIASASHELRTPLQSVIGYTQRLLFERVGRLNKPQRDELEIVERSSHHLLAVIESLLDIAHLESGEIAMQESLFDPHMVVRHVLDTLEPLASVKGLELHGVYNGPGLIETDETKVRQVLLNLVANAVKFTESGTVTLECRCGQGRDVVFAVRDTGPGIPAEELERIFEAFHRVLTNSQENAGAGLGLYVSQVLVAMLGGDIQVESEPGVGTTFTVTLPSAVDAEGVPA